MIVKNYFKKIWKNQLKKLLKTNKTKILKIIYKTKTNLKNWLKNCPMRLLPPTEKNKTRKLLLKSPSQTATSWTGRRRFFFFKKTRLNERWLVLILYPAAWE